MLFSLLTDPRPTRAWDFPLSIFLVPGAGRELLRVLNKGGLAGITGPGGLVSLSKLRHTLELLPCCKLKKWWLLLASTISKHTGQRYWVQSEDLTKSQENKLNPDIY